jgi:AraC-like DNA-binding protein
MVENRILYSGGLISVGIFVCPPEHPRWRGVNVNGDEPLVAFPGTSVVIQHVGREPVLANPNHVIFYAPGTRYRRVLHDERGDRCVFVSFRRQILDRLLAHAGLDPASGEIPFGHAPSEAAAYLRLRIAVSRLLSATGDVLQLEQAAHDALACAVERGATLHANRRRSPRARTEQDHHRLVEDAKALLTERATGQDSLETLARMLHTSAFHLGRIFRAHTGFSLHAYRTQLRLKLALDRLAERPSDLAGMAIELGFNSHSHFTGTFRTAFAVTPSDARLALDAGLGRQLRKTVEAPLLARS